MLLQPTTPFNLTPRPIHPYWVARGLQLASLGDGSIWTNKSGWNFAPTVVGTAYKPGNFGHARGYGAAMGVGTTDRVSLAAALDQKQEIVSLISHVYRNGTGGGGLGRFWDGAGAPGSDVWFANASGLLTYSRYIQSQAASGVATSALAVISSGKWTSAQMVHDQRAGPTNVKFYIEGVYKDEVACGAGTYGSYLNLSWDIGNRASDGLRNFDGVLGPQFRFSHPISGLTDPELRLLADNPGLIFESAESTWWIPVAAGGGVTISATPGNAVADGTAAAVTRIIQALPGGAAADGVVAAVTRIIPALPGGSVADGTTAGVNRVLAGIPGNATADGVTAAVTRIIPALPAGATANGTTAGVNRSVPAAPGNALADGVTTGVVRVIGASPGNAAADGVTATIVNSGTTISCAPGNAVANGTTAAVTRIVGASPGNAVADGPTAAVVRVLRATPGNAAADGIIAALMRTIPALPGNALANGAAASITRVIGATPGNATAAGTTASVYDPGATTYVPALRRMNSLSRARRPASANRAKSLSSPSRARIFTSSARNTA